MQLLLGAKVVSVIVPVSLKGTLGQIVGLNAALPIKIKKRNYPFIVYHNQSVTTDGFVPLKPFHLT